MPTQTDSEEDSRGSALFPTGDRHWAWPLLMLAAIWVPVLLALEVEWRFNEQYQYGYFVPFFTVYLIGLRLRDHPGAGDSVLWGWLRWVPVVGFIPLYVVHTANPDWRPLYAFFVLNALLATFLWMERWAGWRVVLHLTPAWVMMFFAVPWVISVEGAVTLWLMHWVTQLTVEFLNLLGVYAVAQGNLIQLSGTLVGVEEACSGMRSFQSALMAGYLFGELFRFSVSRRILLIAMGVVLNFVLNLVRTFSLTLITHYEGKEVFGRWHDTVGILVMIAGFAGIWGLAWLLGRKPSPKVDAEAEGVPIGELLLRAFPRCFGRSSALVVCGVLSFAWLLDYAWYHPLRVPENIKTGVFKGIEWSELSRNTIFPPIDPVTRAQLKYHTGHQVVWEHRDGSIWTGFYFFWDAGYISSHAGVHRPENCLPSAGLSLAREHPSFTWEAPGGHEVPFRGFTFRHHDRDIEVFFAVWNDNARESVIALTMWDRLSESWKGRRVMGRNSLQFVVEQGGGYERAKGELDHVMGVITSPLKD